MQDQRPEGLYSDNDKPYNEPQCTIVHYSAGQQRMTDCIYVVFDSTYSPVKILTAVVLKGPCKERTPYKAIVLSKRCICPTADNSFTKPPV